MYEIIVDGETIGFEYDKTQAHEMALERVYQLRVLDNINVEWEVREVRL